MAFTAIRKNKSIPKATELAQYPNVSTNQVHTYFSAWMYWQKLAPHVTCSYFCLLLIDGCSYWRAEIVLWGIGSTLKFGLTSSAVCLKSHTLSFTGVFSSYFLHYFMQITIPESFTGCSTLKEIVKMFAIVKMPNIWGANMQLFKVWQYNKYCPVGMLIASRCIFWMKPNLESMFNDIIN